MKNHSLWNYPHGEISEIVDKGATVEFGEISLLSFLLVTLKEEDGKNWENLLISK
jgi:hypothetical protein